MTATTVTRGVVLEIVTIVEHGLNCAGCDDPLEPGATAIRVGAAVYFHDDAACHDAQRYVPVRGRTVRQED